MARQRRQDESTDDQVRHVETIAEVDRSMNHAHARQHDPRQRGTDREHVTQRGLRYVLFCAQVSDLLDDGRHDEAAHGGHRQEPLDSHRTNREEEDVRPEDEG